MSEKIWFKKQRVTKRDKFRDFCKEKGADYFEGGCGVWIIPKKYGETFASIRLGEDKTIQIGQIDEECMNFTATSGWFYFEELEWFGKIATILKKK